MRVVQKMITGILLWGHLLAPGVVFAEGRAHPKPARANSGPDFRGWQYLVARLERDGVPESTLRMIYQNPAMPPFHKVTFSLRPKESVALYRHTYADSRLDLARSFLVNNEKQFKHAEQQFRVSRFVVAAILLVETHFGKNTGKELVINRLSRVAGIGEPNNLLFNYHRLLKDDPSVTYDQVVARARVLEEMFYPELAAFFEVIQRKKVHPFELRGSIAGAFGLPQFLPSSYLRFGYDGDRDGFVSLFKPIDAIYSTANFLASFGWRNEASYEEKRQVVWKYNHSDAYVDTILEIARRLEQPARVQVKPKSGGATKRVVRKSAPDKQAKAPRR